MRRVVVIGGGISGLTAAYRLSQYRSAAPPDITLLDAAARLGGVIQTDRSQGVVLEGGPDSLLRRKPEGLELAEELGLGKGVIGINPRVRGSYIFHDGRFHEIPLGVQAGIPTRLDTLWRSALLTKAEKTRLLGDFALPRNFTGRDMSLGSLLRYRLGDGYVNRIAAPMLSGIYAGDIDKLSTAVTAPQLFHYQQRGRSLIQEAQAAHKTQPPAHSGGIFASLVHGMGSLIEALSRAIEGRVTIRLSTPAVGISEVHGGYELSLVEGESLHATDVIVAVPAYQAAQMLSFWDDAARRALSHIPYADLAVIGAVYESEAFNRVLDRTGFLVPQGEGVGMTAGTWVRSKWDYPDTGSLIPIRAFYGRSSDQGLLTRSDESLLAQFRKEMGYIMGVTDAPRYARVFRIQQGMPQYLVGHQNIIQTIQTQADRFPGFCVIGSYFDGVGIPDCIRQANQAVQTLTAAWT